MGLRRIGIPLLATLLGCDLFGPDVRFVNRRPLHAPSTYARWYAATEGCLGVTGDFSMIRWLVADSILVDGAPKAGYIQFPNDITMWIDRAALGSTVRHEMAHHILAKGNEIHDANGRAPCQSEEAHQSVPNSSM